MDRYPWLVPVVLAAIGVKCVILYSGLLVVGAGFASSALGLPWFATLGLVALLAAIVGGTWYWWTLIKRGSGCPIPSSWIKKAQARNTTVLKRADPAPGASLEEAPERLTLWFHTPVAPTLSNVSLTDENGRTTNAVECSLGDEEGTALVAVLPRLAAGNYTVHWRTLSVMTGQSFAGNFQMAVGRQDPVSGLIPAEG